TPAGGSAAGGAARATASRAVSGVATAPASAASDPWTTYHRDNARSGAVDQPASFSAVTRAWASAELDGDVYAEPLTLDGVVYVATGNDSVYAIDEASGRVSWMLHLGRAVNSSNFPCGNVNPIGVTSTPVIDPGSHRLYAVGMVQGDGAPRHHLFAIDLDGHK